MKEHVKSWHLGAFGIHLKKPGDSSSVQFDEVTGLIKLLKSWAAHIGVGCVVYWHHSVIGIGNFGTQSWQLPGQKVPSYLENKCLLLLSAALRIRWKLFVMWNTAWHWKQPMADGDAHQICCWCRGDSRIHNSRLPKPKHSIVLFKQMPCVQFPGASFTNWAA